MANSKTMWRGQSATLNIDNIQTLSEAHISKYVFDVFNDSTSANESFTNAGEGASNNRAITTSAHVASGNTNGYTDYTVKGYLKYTHNSYSNTTTVATSNVVTNSLRVQEPLDKESLSGFGISPIEVWSNMGGKEHIRIDPSFSYTPFSTHAQITCSQTPNALGGGSAGSASLELNGDASTCYVEYQNTNANKDLGIKSTNIEFYAYSIANKSAAEQKLLYSRSLKVKNAVTKLHIPALLTTYNNATSWSQNHHEYVNYTPQIQYSKEVSLVHAEGDTAYSENTITQNGITVRLDHSTGAFMFDVSDVENVSKTSEFKFRVKSIQGASPVFSNVMTFTVLGFTALHEVDIWEGETKTIDNLGIGAFTLPTGLTNVKVTYTADNLGIVIKGKAVSTSQTESFIITSANGSKVTINCIVKNIADITRTINTGDTITVIGKEIKDATTGTTISSIDKITIGPGQGKGTAYVLDGKLIYYAPTSAVGDTPLAVPITVTTNTGASAVINIKVIDISMSIA